MRRSLLLFTLSCLVVSITSQKLKRSIQEPELQLEHRPDCSTLSASSAINLARDKPTSQSSDYTHMGYLTSSNYGNDGNYNQQFGITPNTFCTNTAGQVRPWWRVDLQNVYFITEVKIWNRGDCCGDRLLPLKIETSEDGDNWKRCGGLTGTGQDGAVYSIPCSGSGRHVRISIDRDPAQALTLCEVEVHGLDCIQKPKPTPRPLPRPTKPSDDHHYIISSWYSSGRGWISSSYTSRMVVSTFDINWLNTYDDDDSDDNDDGTGYVTVNPLGWTSTYEVSSLIKQRNGGWVSTGQNTWKTGK
jgi:hypothetical protein